METPCATGFFPVLSLRPFFERITGVGWLAMDGQIGPSSDGNRAAGIAGKGGRSWAKVAKGPPRCDELRD